MNRSLIISIALTILHAGCLKDESEIIDFDHDRILGDYNTRISGLPGYPDLSDINVSVNRQNADTFYFSFDLQEFDPIPEIAVILTGYFKDENGSYWTDRYADIRIIQPIEYLQPDKPAEYAGYHDPANYIRYMDHYLGNYGRFQLLFQRKDSIGTDSYIRISGERDF